jgi:hypothetical protein
MKNYEVKKKLGEWIVLEITTQLKLASFKDRKDATKFKRQREGGAGFNGFTPAFFIIPMVMPC